MRSYDHSGIIIMQQVIIIISVTWDGDEGRVGKLDAGSGTGQEDGDAPRVATGKKHFPLQLRLLLPLTIPLKSSFGLIPEFQIQVQSFLQKIFILIILVKGNRE